MTELYDPRQLLCRNFNNIIWLLVSHDGPMVSTQVRQSEGSGFKSRSGQIANFHSVKTRLSTLGDVPRGSDST